MRSELEIQTLREAQALVMSLIGVLDGRTTHDLEELCRSDLVQESQHIVFQLDQLTYISLAGMNVFFSLNQNKRQIGGSVHLVNPIASVAEVFKLVGLQALFSLHLDVNSALKSTAEVDA
jgi:stage II sporulation protein AA (anti-sigma F factor antagonist)